MSDGILHLFGDLGGNFAVSCLRSVWCIDISFLSLSSFLQVKEELDLANDSTKVFKLIGPALVTQDLSEAKGNVQKRIEYIR